MLEVNDKTIIDQAILIIEKNLTATTESLNSSDTVKKLCTLKLALLESEVFAALMLNSQHELIAFVELAKGTINCAAIYPREVVKSVLAHNAATVIFTHNHPSGNAEPSREDKLITGRLSEALNLIDVNVLDHIIVAGTSTTSFAEQGLL